MDRLIAEAKKRNIYIVMDLVVNHCSDEHEWFKKAMADPDGEYGRYFYIAEKKDGKLGIADEEEEEYEDEEEVPEFKYEEKLPVGIDSHLNLYQYETFCFTNMKVTLKGKKIFKTEDHKLVYY